jgi:hypothetical protein
VNPTSVAPYLVSILLGALLDRRLSFLQGLYNKLASGRNKDEKYDLATSDPAFPKHPGEVGGVFSLGYNTKVSHNIIQRPFIKTAISRLAMGGRIRHNSFYLL